MNIGSMIRGLLGEQKPGEVKTLELRPGQVVRGVVMNVAEDGQTAVVQIQGVQVKAKLEAPLRAGESALLQVQPPGEGGTAVLKPLSQTPGQPLSPSSMAQVLEFAGLPDTKENREMIRGMQTAGVPLTKENIALFREALAMKPVHIPAAEWTESTAIAFHRGLPVSPDSVRGLHQAVFGPQLHQLLQALEQQLAPMGSTAEAARAASLAASGSASAASGTAAGAETPAAPMPNAAATGATQAGTGQQQLLTRLQGLLHQLRSELTQLPGPTGGTAVPAAGQTAAAPSGPAAAPGEGAAGPSPKSPTPVAEPWVGRLLKLLGAEHEQQALRGAGQGPAGAASTAATSTVAQPAANPAGSAASALPNAVAAAPATPAAAATAAASQQPTTAQQPAGAQQPVSTAAATAVNAGTTQGTNIPASNLASASAQPVPGFTPNVQPPQATPITGLPAAATIVSGAGDSIAQQDTLKGVLLQVLASQDTPPALKEAAQQFVQHLTGQQLLLNTDRTAPFAQVTMFIPLHGADGEQTASVHIQSRRGQKGELDAANCRLLFDLDMKFLGPTLIDVQVVDRIVSLQFRNDHEVAAELFEGRKQELTAAVESIGYQLLSVRTEPLPVASKASIEPDVQGTAAEFTPQSYKGVDLRI